VHKATTLNRTELQFSPIQFSGSAQLGSVALCTPLGIR